MLFEADYAKNYASILYQCLQSRVLHDPGWFNDAAPPVEAFIFDSESIISQNVSTKKLSRKAAVNVFNCTKRDSTFVLSFSCQIKMLNHRL